MVRPVPDILIQMFKTKKLEIMGFKKSPEDQEMLFLIQGTSPNRSVVAMGKTQEELIEDAKHQLELQRALYVHN